MGKMYTGQIDLFRLKGSFLKTLRGRTAEKQCLCIPLDDAMLFSGKNGIYLDIVVFENDPGNIRFDQTHSIKQSLTREQREAMGDVDTPYLGNLKLFVRQDLASLAAATEQKEDMQDIDSDIPY